PTEQAGAIALGEAMAVGREQLDVAAAEGAGRRAGGLSYAPEEDDARAYDDGPPPTDLSIRAGGSQTHLAELDLEDSTRILVSVPQDGSAALVVSSEGHDQLVDLLTGERQDDDVAAAYYRA